MDYLAKAVNLAVVATNPATPAAQRPVLAAKVSELVTKHNLRHPVLAEFLAAALKLGWLA